MKGDYYRYLAEVASGTARDGEFPVVLFHSNAISSGATPSFQVIIDVSICMFIMVGIFYMASVLLKLSVKSKISLPTHLVWTNP